MTSTLENNTVSDQKSADRFNQVVDELDQTQIALQAQINAAQQKFEKIFPELVKDFFAAVPQIKSVTWTQYSPYFNDGDACTFSVNEVFFATDENKEFGVYRNEEDYDENEEDDGEVAERDENFFSDTYYSLKKQKFLTKEQIEMCKKLDELISLNEDTMESMFGNGTVIVLRADGIETQDYDHD